jgi:hypothetical protein
MSLAKTSSLIDFGEAGLLVVLGGQSREVAESVTAALRSALATYRVDVVAWEPGDSASGLTTSARELLRSR